MASPLESQFFSLSALWSVDWPIPIFSLYPLIPPSSSAYTAPPYFTNSSRFRAVNQCKTFESEEEAADWSTAYHRLPAPPIMISEENPYVPKYGEWWRGRLNPEMMANELRINKVTLAVLVSLGLVVTVYVFLNTRKNYTSESRGIPISQLIAASIDLVELGGKRVVEVRNMGDSEIGRLSKGLTKQGKSEYVTLGDKVAALPTNTCLLFIGLFCVTVLWVVLCFVLFCFVLFCFVLFCFVLFCFVLFCFLIFFNLLLFLKKILLGIPPDHCIRIEISLARHSGSV